MKEMRPAIFALSGTQSSTEKGGHCSAARYHLFKHYFSKSWRGKEKPLLHWTQLLNPPLDICQDKHEQMSKAAWPRSFGHVQVREPIGQRCLGAAFLASFFAVKERREPTHTEVLNYIDEENIGLCSQCEESLTFGTVQKREK